MDKEVLRHIEGVDSAEWERIVLKLTLYAGYLLKRLSWRTGVVPKGLEADDLALESIKEVLDGQRKWNPFNNPDLLNYLKSVVKSKVSHLYNLKEYDITDRYIVKEDGKTIEELQKKADPATDHAVHLVQEITKCPEEILLEKQEDDNDKKVMDSFFETIKGDNELEELILLIMEGYTKPREIAKQIGKDVMYVYNLMKRFRRKCDEFKANSNVK